MHAGRWRGDLRGRGREQAKPSEGRELESFGKFQLYLTVETLEDNDFQKSAVDSIVETCDLSGEDGFSFGDPQDVQRSNVTRGGLAGYRLSLGCRNPRTRAPNGTVNTVVAFDVSTDATHRMLKFSCRRGAKSQPRPPHEKLCDDILGTFQKN